MSIEIFFDIEKSPKALVEGILDELHIDVDLSAYATKEELTQAISNIDLSAYATNEYVDKAIASVSTSEEVNLDNYYTKEETYNKVEIDNLIPDVTNGKDGIDGKDGVNGVDGKDGADGQDGFSPVATVTKSGNTATITITDKNGTTTATVSDDKDGAGGGSSGGGGEVYSTEEMEIGTWIDGKTIYQRLFDLSDITPSKNTQFNVYSYRDNDLHIENVVDSRLVFRSGSTTYTSTQFNNMVSQSSVGNLVNAINSSILTGALFHFITSAATYTTIQTFIGTVYSTDNKKIYVVLKYTKP